MKFAVDLPNFGPFSDPHMLMDVARETEATGWDGFFIWDHLTRPTRHDVIDPWIGLSAVAVVTERVKLGAMVTPIPRRRPWKLARETVTLDHLSKGRLVLGVGLGGASGVDVEWANFGEEMNLKTRAQMLDEGLAIMDGLWSGEPFSFEGDHYTVKETHFTPTPYQKPRIPIWVGGYWDNKPPFRRAARWDGMLPLFPAGEDHVKLVRECIDFTMSQRESDAPFDVVYMADPSIPNRAETAAALADAGVTWYFEAIHPRHFGTDVNERWNVDAMRDHIRSGPPHLE